MAALKDCGAEVVDWEPHSFADYIERTALATRRIAAIGVAIATDNSCGR